MTARELYGEAIKRGLRLELRGDKLAVIPKAKCPPEFADMLRRHKRELLVLLETDTANLTPDCLPWLYVARQILAGEFDGADHSTAESLIIGLRGIPHSLCQEALRHVMRASEF